MNGWITFRCNLTLTLSYLPRGHLIKIRDLRNLGPASEQTLLDAGIDSVDTLRQLGTIKSYYQVITHSPSNANLNLLFAIEGALCDSDWKVIAKNEKGRLLIELDSIEQLNNINFGEE